MAMFPHILTHSSIYPSFLRSCSSSALSSHTTASLSPELSPSTTNTSFLVENILRDRAAAAAAAAAASQKDCSSPFISRPLPLHGHDPCVYPNCGLKQCDYVKREAREALNSSDQETESSYGGDPQSASSTPPIKSSAPLKFGVNAILSDSKDVYATSKSASHGFLTHKGNCIAHKNLICAF